MQTEFYYRCKWSKSWLDPGQVKHDLCRARGERTSPAEIDLMPVLSFKQEAIAAAAANKNYSSTFLFLPTTVKKEHLLAVYSNTCHVYFWWHLPADSPALNIEHAEKLRACERAESKPRGSRWKQQSCSSLYGDHTLIPGGEKSLSTKMKATVRYLV